MDIKIEIKEESSLSEVLSDTEKEHFSQDATMKLNIDAVLECNRVCKTENKTEIKENNVVSDLNRDNDSCSLSESNLTKVKQCHDDYEMETNTDINEEYVIPDIYQQNDYQYFSELPVMTVIQDDKDSEMDTKIEIKEEIWWPAGTSTEAPCVDVTKDLVDESLSSTESIRIPREVPRGKSVLCSEENSGKNGRQDNPECKATKIYRNEEKEI